jgi:hypothetical protein
MTPAEEAEFIALWQAGTEAAEIARCLGIPKGMVSSRAGALRKRGMALAKRPQGGAYPSQRAKARQEDPPVDTTTLALPTPAHLMVFVMTNRFSTTRPFYGQSATIRLPYPTDYTPDLIRAAVPLLERIYRPGFHYQKCGVMLMDLSPAVYHPRDLFDTRDQARQARLWVIAACLGCLAVTATSIKPGRRNTWSRWHTDRSRQVRLSMDHGHNGCALRTDPIPRASGAAGCFLHPWVPRGDHLSERKGDEVV